MIRLVVGDLDTNCYVLTCNETGRQAIIDPGGDPDRIRKALKIPDRILLTHCHFDHTGAVLALKDEYDLPVACSTHEPCDLCDQRLEHGDRVRFGENELEVVETPGHTPGGLSYRLGTHLFCGDTVFQGAMGATHYPGGDFETLIRTITGVVFSLPDETTLHPGHGPDTTVGAEKRSGFYPIL
jgi:glyoxylase-like metal-dependent hydrolase (beta-lactamase superfamily II)